MSYDKTLQKHIRCKKGDVAEYVLLPGDPARAVRIAAQMDEAHKVAQNREYVVYTGMKAGVPVSVCSTGIGGPSAAIAIEELARIGAQNFIRVGSAGGRKEYIPVGSVVIVNGAVRGDGTSQEYLPSIYPAIADFEITQALIETARELGEKYFVGISFSRDAYYMQNEELNQLLLDTNVAVSEMECATLFTVAAKRNLKVGAIVGTDSNIIIKKQFSLKEKDELYMEAEKKIITIALEAVVKLAGKVIRS